ncbi:MAG: hypothetical protein EOO43_16870, partial [Flavobacterium sp.]
VHECKFKVDGITKYVENNNFTFDNTFNEGESNEDIYKYSIFPHVDFILNQGIVTCFAYGQTGSGKTFTMVKCRIEICLKINRKVFKIQLFEIFLKLLERNISNRLVLKCLLMMIGI